MCLEVIGYYGTIIVMI